MGTNGLRAGELIENLVSQCGESDKRGLPYQRDRIWKRMADNCEENSHRQQR
jgi:hypothetical protein